MSNSYPEEIYCYPETAGPAFRERGPVNTVSGRAVAEQAYDLGYKRGVQEAATEPEWFNLTEQIAEGSNIDWEKLDVAKARCVHVSGVVCEYKLSRDDDYSASDPDGWYQTGSTSSWVDALTSAWLNRGDWTLYIDRPVPLKRKTADQLEPGTCFVGKTTTDDGPCYCIRYTGANGKALAVHISSGTVIPAKKFTVLEEYGIGTFKAVDDEA